jgi:N-glycosidase YbiA
METDTVGSIVERIEGRKGTPPVYFKSVLDDAANGVDLRTVTQLAATYYYLNESYQSFCDTRLGVPLPLPCWVLQDLISEKLFGTSGLRTLQTIVQNAGPSLFAPEFANVHSTFEWREPPLLVDGVLYTSGGPEAFFQGQKAVGTVDEGEVARRIVTADPDEAFNIGRNSELRADWNEVKDEIMYKGVFAKFSQNNRLKQLLLSTGRLPLGQVKPNDSYWGSGNNGKGRNVLGSILMKVRSDL